MADNKSNNKKSNKKSHQRGGRRRSRDFEEKDKMEQRILDLARITRVTKGGKRLRFRACVAVGDRSGQVAVGVGKGSDVARAIEKAVKQAEKDIIKLDLDEAGTIPFELKGKYKAAKVMLRPATKGTGIIAGGVVRNILELSGLENVVSKIYGSNNKVNNAKATMNMLKKISQVKDSAVFKIGGKAQAEEKQKQEQKSEVEAKSSKVQGKEEDKAVKPEKPAGK